MLSEFRHSFQIPRLYLLWIRKMRNLNRRFAGGWQSTPVSGKRRTVPASTPIHENDCHIEAPTIITPDMSLRKSEAPFKSRKAFQISLTSENQCGRLQCCQVDPSDVGRTSDATTPRLHESPPLSTICPNLLFSNNHSLLLKPLSSRICMNYKKKKCSTMEPKEHQR